MKNLDKKNCIIASIFYQSLGSSLHRCFTVKRENVQKPGSKEFNLYKSRQTRKVNREGVSIDLTVLFSMLFSMLLAFYTYIDRVYPSTTKTVFPTQIRAPFLAASLTASHIPSYGQTETLLLLLSLVLSNARWLETALSIFDISINNLQKGKSSC